MSKVDAVSTCRGVGQNYVQVIQLCAHHWLENLVETVLQTPLYSMIIDIQLGTLHSTALLCSALAMSICLRVIALTVGEGYKNNKDNKDQVQGQEQQGQEQAAELYL